MLFAHQNYRGFLRQILVERTQRNPRYSLRAFASQLSLSPSMLSEVLSGEKTLSTDKALAVASKLGLNSQEEAYFVGLVQLEDAGTVDRREKILERLNELTPSQPIRDLSIDQFHSIANWICAAGMALIQSKPKGATAETLAKRLGITKFEAQEAMDRWIRLELLELKSDGRYVAVAGPLLMKSESANQALRQYHRTMLGKAIESLESQTSQEKFVGSETLAVDPRDLAAVSEEIEIAVRKIIAKTKKSKNRNEVYHLGFQFFRVTKKEK